MEAYLIVSREMLKESCLVVIHSDTTIYGEYKLPKYSQLMSFPYTDILSREKKYSFPIIVVAPRNSILLQKPCLTSQHFYCL